MTDRGIRSPAKGLRPPLHIGLTGRIALVTGSTQGIGAAVAVALARAGPRVGVNGRDEQQPADSDTSPAGQPPGAGLVPVAADVSGEEGAARVAHVLPQVGILVDNRASPVPPTRWRQASATTGGAPRVDGGYIDSILP